MHIKVNMNEGVYYNIRKVELINEALKSKKILESVLTITVKICNDKIQLRHNTTIKSVKQWKSKSENIIKLHLKHVKDNYSVCSFTESLMKQINIVYYLFYNMKEKWDCKILFMWSLYENIMQNNERAHS